LSPRRTVTLKTWRQDTHWVIRNTQSLYYSYLWYFSPYNLNRQYFTWHLINSHLFDNHKLVPRSFLFFFTACLLVYSKDILECQMTLFIFPSNIYKHSTLFRIVWCSKYIFTATPQNVLELITKVQIIFDLFFLPLSIFTVFFSFFPSKIHSVYTFRCAVMFLVKFK